MLIRENSKPNESFGIHKGHPQEYPGVIGHTLIIKITVFFNHQGKLWTLNPKFLCSQRLFAGAMRTAWAKSLMDKEIWSPGATHPALPQRAEHCIFGESKKNSTPWDMNGLTLELATFRNAFTTQLPPKLMLHRLKPVHSTTWRVDYFSRWPLVA